MSGRTQRLRWFYNAEIHRGLVARDMRFALFRLADLLYRHCSVIVRKGKKESKQDCTQFVWPFTVHEFNE